MEEGWGWGDGGREDELHLVGDTDAILSRGSSACSCRGVGRPTEQHNGARLTILKSTVSLPSLSPRHTFCLMLPTADDADVK